MLMDNQHNVISMMRCPNVGVFPGFFAFPVDRIPPYYAPQNDYYQSSCPGWGGAERRTEPTRGHQSLRLPRRGGENCLVVAPTRQTQPAQQPDVRSSG